MTELVSCRHVDFSFGPQKVLDRLNLTVQEGKKHVLLGSSGCGKTTLLNLIGGIYPVASGEILLKDRVVSGSQFVPPEKRNIGRVFQDFALFPHLNINENIAFGLHNKKLDRASKQKKYQISWRWWDYLEWALRAHRSFRVGSSRESPWHEHWPSILS